MTDNCLKSQEKLEPQCQYFVARKKRLCRMTVRPGRNYCGEHEPQPRTESGQDDTRVPCPYDPKHTCYASKLEKHLLICNARQTEQPPYIIHNINCPPADDAGCERKPLSQIPEDVLQRVVDKINYLYETHVKGKIETIPEPPLHPVVAGSFCEARRGHRSQRHLRQASALLTILETCGLVGPRTCYVELGAGKGQLSYYAGVAWCGGNTRSSVLVVDRAALRHKKDNKLRNHTTDNQLNNHCNKRSTKIANRNHMINANRERTNIDQSNSAGNTINEKGNVFDVKTGVTTNVVKVYPHNDGNRTNETLNEDQITNVNTRDLKICATTNVVKVHPHNDTRTHKTVSEDQNTSERLNRINVNQLLNNDAERLSVKHNKSANDDNLSKRSNHINFDQSTDVSVTDNNNSNNMNTSTTTNDSNIRQNSPKDDITNEARKDIGDFTGADNDVRSDMLRNDGDAKHATKKANILQLCCKDDEARKDIGDFIDTDNDVRNDVLKKDGDAKDATKKDDDVRNLMMGKNCGDTCVINTGDDIKDDNLRNVMLRKDNDVTLDVKDVPRHSDDSRYITGLINTGDDVKDLPTKEYNDVRNDVSGKDSDITNVSKTGDVVTDVAIRLRADLAHLALARVDAVASAEHVVGFAKHLCGVATELALRCITSQEVVTKTRGILVATCCHHRCEMGSLLGYQRLRQLGFTREELGALLGIVSWATCGDGRPRAARVDKGGSGDDASRIAARERIGRRAKALIDFGRAHMLSSLGFTTRLLRYVPRTVSPENLAILATKGIANSGD